MNDTPANEISIHVPRMYRVAYRLLADADKAHDAVQEACVKALAKIREFNGRCSLATWLHRITVNCAKDARRAEVRKNNVFSRLLIHTAPSGQTEAPVDPVEIKELADRAWSHLDELDKECRSAFILTQLDGYSYDEAAQIENQPRGTIASRVFRAKKILLEQMNAHIERRAKS